MSKRDQGLTLRFAVGAPGQPRSSVWRLWAPGVANSRSDVYLTVRSQAANFKVSFHQSGECLEGLASALAAKQPELLEGGPRVRRRWRRAIRPTGELRDTFRILVPAFALRPEPEDRDSGVDIRWLAAPQPGHIAQVSLVFTDATFVNISPSAAKSVADRFARWELPNGESLFLRYSYVPLTSDIRQAYEKIRQEYAPELEIRMPDDERERGQARATAGVVLRDGVRAMLDLPVPMPASDRDAA